MSIHLFSLPILATVLAIPATECFGQERTVDEFKEYVRERTSGRLDDRAVEEIAKRVDKDGDGVISETEFANRMRAFRTVVGQGDRRSGRAAERGDMAEPDKKVRGNQKPVAIPPLAASTDAPLLLITSSEIAQAWIPFAKWKTAHGKLTKIVTIEQVAANYEANTIQEKIRLCVRAHIDRHRTRWVLLGGDCLPDGQGLVPGGHQTVHAQERAGIPTDIVYLSKSNWDADGDGIYGEFEDDRDAIEYPDGSVGLGRVPVRTAADVKAFTDKVIEYESNYPTDEFAKRMVYTCTDRPAYPKVRNSWDRYLSAVWAGTRSALLFRRDALG